MRIVVEEIPQEGLEVAVGPGEPWAMAAARTALEGEILDLSGRLEVRRVGPGVQVTGSVAATVARACDRCLADVRLRVEGPVQQWFEGLPADAPESRPLTADALDVGFLDGAELDLDAALTEFLALESPSVVRCGEPGITRVEPGPCELSEGVADEVPRGSGFAALKGVVLDD